VKRLNLSYSLKYFPVHSAISSSLVCISRRQQREERASDEEQVGGARTRCFFGTILQSIIDSCYPSASNPLTMSLFDFRYLQFSSCSLDTTRPLLVLLFPLDCLHGARAQDVGLEACQAFAFLGQSFDLGLRRERVFEGFVLDILNL
jgi:hypothetical protein